MMKLKSVKLKTILLIGVNVLLVAAILILSAVFAAGGRKYDSQTAAERWQSGDMRYSQISVFLSKGAQFTGPRVQSFRHTIDDKLVEESIKAETAGARLWMDAYLGEGSLSVKGKSKGAAQAVAFGVGGDFFYFHPFPLITGSYFDPEADNRDFVLIDETLAWQLFGSNDVVGMEVEINEKTFYVSGVIERDKDPSLVEAYEYAPLIYLSYDALSELGEVYVTSYEAVLPNPISEYAKKMVSENIGVAEEDMEIIENTERFSAPKLFTVLMSFNERSTRTNSVPLPYWENTARTHENTLALLLLAICILCICPAVCLILLLVFLWRHRPFHKQDVKDFFTRLQEWRWAKQKERARKKEEAAQHKNLQNKLAMLDRDDKIEGTGENKVAGSIAKEPSGKRPSVKKPSAKRPSVKRPSVKRPSRTKTRWEWMNGKQKEREIIPDEQVFNELHGQVEPNPEKTGSERNADQNVSPDERDGGTGKGEQR